jgi:hypothetical protein
MENAHLSSSQFCFQLLVTLFEVLSTDEVRSLCQICEYAVEAMPETRSFEILSLLFNLCENVAQFLEIGRKVLYQTSGHEESTEEGERTCI